MWKTDSRKHTHFALVNFVSQSIDNAQQALSFKPNIWPVTYAGLSHTHKPLCFYKHPAKYGNGTPSPFGLKQQVVMWKERIFYHKHWVQISLFSPQLFQTVNNLTGPKTPLCIHKCLTESFPLRKGFVAEYARMMFIWGFEQHWFKPKYRNACHNI